MRLAWFILGAVAASAAWILGLFVASGFRPGHWGRWELLRVCRCRRWALERFALQQICPVCGEAIPAGEISARRVLTRRGWRYEVKRTPEEIEIEEMEKSLGITQ